MTTTKRNRPTSENGTESEETTWINGSILAESPELRAAQAVDQSLVLKALETAQNWAEREKRDDPTPAKNDPNKATADTISPCREGEQVLSRSEVEELRAENARLRALLGIVDGHAGEIVRALSTAEATR